ncbi:hypothetical protein K227x_09430 [Rubripirellula lacrimiformis]|uniref:Uncharacterized protein n=1 Tax=Rubripirellula lacrimiformis TaxID=1930273 RepID=A0A517N5Z9_9BACT|nr:hypothetical protein [Rubripirellula lacrimiformis]QDT02565.1 hypothetical protein K227x_09430 [Rubripirellula lacrimiformis]
MLSLTPLAHRFYEVGVNQQKMAHPSEARDAQPEVFGDTFLVSHGFDGSVPDEK